MLFDSIRHDLLERLKAVLPAEAQADAGLEMPPDQTMGDFAFPTFKLAKSMRKAPPIIAKDLAEKLGADAAVARLCNVSVAGSYVNFAVKREILVGEVLRSLLLSKATLGERTLAGEPKVVMEFSSPNVAKPFNIYHLRGTMIGNCLARIFRARGYKTVSINHLGDWGTQYGTLAVAFELWGDDAELDRRGIEYLVELYVRINKELEPKTPEAEALKLKTREYFARLEKGDAKIKALWERFVQLSIKEFKRTYGRLNVEFDHYWGESFYLGRVPALEKELEDKHLLVESQGAQVVDLEKFGMPPCIVRKADGSTIYATRDLAAAIYRHEKLGFEKMVYVVGGEQKLHFAQVFKTLELMGHAWAAKCVHIDFGLYRFQDAKMSTRKGNFVTLEAVLDEAVARVQQIMTEKAEATAANATVSEKVFVPMSADERAKAAEVIGTGAVIFNDLSTDRNSPVNFDLDRVCDFEGETGPYVQYAHTRCLGILRNAPAALFGGGVDTRALLDLAAEQPGFAALASAAGAKLALGEELDLLRTLAKLPIVLDQVLDSYRPHTLATYLIDVTKSFNAFYRAHKVLIEDQELARARLALVLMTQRTLLKGLTLLGMRAPERM